MIPWEALESIHNHHASANSYDSLGEACREHPAIRQVAPDPETLDETLQLLRTGLNSPASSSLGRWFDAVAALCGVAAENRFEGEAPMLLESAAAAGVGDAYEFRVEADGPFQIDLRPAVVGLLDDLVAGTEAGVVSAKFHNTVAAFLLASARRARETTGLEVVALSGGCFANRYLTARVVALLESDGFEVLTHHRVPTNDGGVALGQAVIAAARLGRDVGAARV